MQKYKSTSYLLQDNDSEEFFSSFGYTRIITIPVLFGAKDFDTEEEAYAFKNDTKNKESLLNFSVVKRVSEVTIEKV